MLGLSAISLFACTSVKEAVTLKPQQGGPTFSLVVDSTGTRICEEWSVSVQVDTSKTNELLRQGFTVQGTNFEGRLWMDLNGVIKFYEKGCVYIKQ